MLEDEKMLLEEMLKGVLLEDVLWQDVLLEVVLSLYIVLMLHVLRPIFCSKNKFVLSIQKIKEISTSSRQYKAKSFFMMLTHSAKCTCVPDHYTTT